MPITDASSGRVAVLPIVAALTRRRSARDLDVLAGLRQPSEGQAWLPAGA
jgi:hypothetical protein